jgi:hypothetical protein
MEVFDRFEDLIMGPSRERLSSEQIGELYRAMPAGMDTDEVVQLITAAQRAVVGGGRTRTIVRLTYQHPLDCVCTRCFDPSDFSFSDDLWRSYQPVDPFDEDELENRCECDDNDPFMLCDYCEERELEAWAAWDEMVESQFDPEIPGCSRSVAELSDEFELEFDREQYGARFL